MARKIDTPFINKEGKYFSAILYADTNYIVQNGAVVESGERIIGGVKGVYAKVRMTINSPEEAALFSINTEFFPSSR